MEINEITNRVIGAAIRVHQGLGPGLLESVYEVVLGGELTRQGFLVERQKAVDFVFEGIRYEHGFVVDLLVHGTVVVELKSVEQLAQVHRKQLLTYLRLMNLNVGLLINFGGSTLKEGLVRIVNGPAPSVSPVSSV